MSRYLKIWSRFSIASFQAFFISRVSAGLFLLGKAVRIMMYLLFILFIFSRTKVLAGYKIWEIMLFYMTFNFIDAATQMLFREVYRFRHYIISGNFDLILVKPVNPLFRSLFGWTDFLDFLTIIPFIGTIVFVMLNLSISISGVILYILLVLNSLVIAASFHIFVLAMGVMTTEVDHTVMIYRDITSMGKFPVDIYNEPIRSLITFILPVGIMMTFPVKGFLGSVHGLVVIVPFIVSGVLLFTGVAFWKQALRKYSSASS